MFEVLVRFEFTVTSIFPVKSIELVALLAKETIELLPLAEELI